MSQNVAQWLAEIQSLQRQVTMLQQEREQAYNSVKSWRDLYEGEAKQRQRDAKAQERRIAQLERSLQDLQSPNQTTAASSDNILKKAAPSGPNDESTELSPALSPAGSVEQLRMQLSAAQNQCEQLKQQLTAERESHERTRESLTAALGDAVDLLAKERQAGTQTPSQ